MARLQSKVRLGVLRQGCAMWRAGALRGGQGAGSFCELALCMPRCMA